MNTDTMLHVRWMIRSDMPSVMEIERSSFDMPWSDADFKHALGQRNIIGMVCEHGADVVGFMLYEIHSNNIHLLNLAVAKDCRRSGVGTAMIAKLKGKLSLDRRNRIMLEVRESNLNAQLFFKSLGFRAIAILKDYYDETHEDAYSMRFRHTEQRVNRDFTCRGAK